MMTTFSVTQAAYTIQVQLQQIGPDLLLLITGGDHPHIGAVTTLSPQTVAKTVRFPSHDGRLHKDGVLSELLAKQIQPVIKGTCTITAGVHVDQISQRQIMAASTMVKTLGQQVVRWLKQHPAKVTPPQYYGPDEQPQ